MGEQAEYVRVPFADSNAFPVPDDRAMKSAGFGTDRGSALSEAIRACRKGGTVSVAGFYCGAGDDVPLGAAFTKGLTLKMGPAHVPRYALMRWKDEGCLKVVLQP